MQCTHSHNTAHVDLPSFLSDSDYEASSFWSLSFSAASSHFHSLTHLPLLMKCCIIRIVDCRRVPGPIEPCHTFVCSQTQIAMICTHPSHRSHHKPLQIIHTSMRLWRPHTVVEGGWTYNTRAYRGKRVRPYLTRQHARYVNFHERTERERESLCVYSHPACICDEKSLGGIFGNSVPACKGVRHRSVCQGVCYQHSAQQAGGSTRAQGRWTRAREGVVRRKQV